MSGIDANEMQDLVGKIEALKKTLESEGEKGRTKLKNINEVLQQILHTKEGKFDSKEWGDLDNESRRLLHSELSRVLDALNAPARGAKQPCGYGAALIGTSILLPAAAAVLTVVIVLVKWPTPYSLAPVWGTLGALAAWLVLSLLCREVADARHAVPTSYGELLPRLDELQAGLRGFCPAAGPASNPCENTAYNAAVKHYDEIRRDLEEKGSTWALATGYIKVWERLYRAEEALIEFAPKKKVLESALYDEARLEGSDIKNREDLLAKLRKAVVSNDPSAHKYLKLSAAVTAPPALAIGTTALPGGTVAVGYCASLLAAGGVPPYKWAVIGGAIPDALVLSTAGVLRGTPTSDGHASFTVQVSDSAGLTVEKYFDLLISPQTQATPSPLAINTTAPLPWGTVDAEYAERLVASGGKPPYKWKVIEGAIPDGMDLSDEGVLSGRPIRGNTFEFEVEVADSTGPSPIKRKFTLLIKPSGTSGAVRVGSTQAELNARGVLSDVRRSVNEYRNSRWKGLILARNRLLATFTLTTMVVFALLAIAIMSGAERTNIIAAMVFYLVGATVGLCNRLRSASQAESEMPDYGLSAARLITLPLFSGLGAIGGLLVAAYLPFATPVFAPSPPLVISTISPLPTKGAVDKPYRQILGATGGTRLYTWSFEDKTPVGWQLTPEGVLSGTPTQSGEASFNVRVTDSAGSTASKKFSLAVEKSTQVQEPANKPAEQTDRTGAKPTPEPLGQAGGGNITPQTNEKAPSKLEDIFNLKKNLIGLFVAAVFGLTPGLLFDRLQQQTDRYKADLKSSQSSEGTQKS